MFDVTAMKSKSQQIIWDVLEKCNETYKVELDFPQLHWVMIGTTAGRAYLTVWKIELNLQLCKETWEDFQKETIPHEVAHLVAYKVFGDAGHGEGWKSVMRSLGIVPQRCHNYESDHVKGKRSLNGMYN